MAIPKHRLAEWQARHAGGGHEVPPLEGSAAEAAWLAFVALQAEASAAEEAEPFDSKAYDELCARLVDTPRWEGGLLLTEDVKELWRLMRRYTLLSQVHGASLTPDGAAGKDGAALRCFQARRRLERLCICLLGHPLHILRDAAVRMLHVLYDGVDWQAERASEVAVRFVGDSCDIAEDVQLPDGSEVVLQLCAPSFLPGSSEDSVLTFHSVSTSAASPPAAAERDDKEEEKKGEVTKAGVRIIVDEAEGGKKAESDAADGSVAMAVRATLAALPRTGFYDWRLVAVSKTDGSMSAVLRSGRFIVHRAGLSTARIHEVVVDLLGAEWDESAADGSGRITRRGSFTTVREALPSYASRGCTAVFLMGAAERDNGEPAMERAGERPREDASPMSITDRRMPNRMLGGPEAFAQLVATAEELGVDIVTQLDGSVSASRMHRRYRGLVCHMLDVDGQWLRHKGTDAQENQWGDLVQLNYRMQATWDVLLEDAMALATDRGVRGLYLTEAQSAPTILQLDVAEMFRLDTDGVAHYTPQQILDGQVVVSNAESGFYACHAAATYGNPLFAKLARHLWAAHSGFLLLGQEHWDRALPLLRSGLLPHGHGMMNALASVWGRTVDKGGQVSQGEVDTDLPVHQLAAWLAREAELTADLARLRLRSTCTHASPYPALLYGRGAWAAVDLLYLLPGVPMTFTGEQDGHSYRVEMTHLYRLDSSWWEEQALLRSSEPDLPLHVKLAREAMLSRSSSGGRTGRSMGPRTPLGAVRVPHVRSWASLTSRRGSVGEKPVPRIRSLSQLKGLKDLSSLEAETAASLGPEWGFDLAEIRHHYSHRSAVRDAHAVLREGALAALPAMHMYGRHPNVVAFARYFEDASELAVVAVNLNESESTFYVDCSAFLHLFDVEAEPPLEELLHGSIVYRMNDVLVDGTAPAAEEGGEKFSLLEMVREDFFCSLKPFQSLCHRFVRCEATPGVQADFFASSWDRLLQGLGLKRNTRMRVGLRDDEVSAAIFHNHIFTLLRRVLTGDSVEQFGTILATIKERLGRTYEETNGPRVLQQALLFCARAVGVGTAKLVRWLEQLRGDSSFAGAVDRVLSHNQLGPVVFVTPELGKWSKVGGLGVMVDELTQGLAAMGMEVIVISPYYERNRKGATGYLAADGFKWKRNIHTTVGGDGVELGVHTGRLRGVEYIFLHNALFFPSTYPDGDAEATLRMLVCFAKASLEALCQEHLIPSLLVTNDWFAGLVAAYAHHSEAFGTPSVFRDTTCFHICHNLDISYEGRLYPADWQGSLQHVHGLPEHLLVDPYWRGPKVINPSRCAIMASNSWGTVSRSYLADLLSSSPLAPLLRRAPQPFGYPNGLPVAVRKSKLLWLPHNTPASAKAALQQKYFGYRDPDLSVPMFGFVGRITEQKGVHLMLNAVAPLIEATGGRVQFIIGGKVTWSDPYSERCGHLMRDLAGLYPSCFWADPSLFFTDGPLVNLGCDYGMMPSLFEPGGIVQHEFLIAGTPVIAFKTGGLKDTVHEWNAETKTGNGFTFEAHADADFQLALHRALETFHDPASYAALRRHAATTVIDLATVAWEWYKEFYRIRRCLSGAVENVLLWTGDSRGGDSHVTVRGSWDDWKEEIDMAWDAEHSEHRHSVQLPVGTYHYCFFVDGERTVDEHFPTLRLEDGRVANVFTIAAVAE